MPAALPCLPIPLVASVVLLPKPGRASTARRLLPSCHPRVRPQADEGPVLSEANGISPVRPATHRPTTCQPLHSDASGAQWIVTSLECISNRLPSYLPEMIATRRTSSPALRNSYRLFAGHTEDERESHPVEDTSRTRRIGFLLNDISRGNGLRHGWLQSHSRESSALNSISTSLILTAPHLPVSTSRVMGMGSAGLTCRWRGRMLMRTRSRGTTIRDTV